MNHQLGPRADESLAFLAGGGEMGRRTRDFDWSPTALGPVERWPQSLRSALSICLNSSFPIALYWGSDLTLLYNDDWSPIPGAKHPRVLGRPARDAWPEIWHIIEPLFRRVMATGEATRSRDQLLPMHRHGYTEECYFDYTFSPIRGESGAVEGVFNAVLETTARVIGERRLRTLRELAAWRAGGDGSVMDACRTAARILDENPHDLPFALVYLLDDDGRRAVLAGRTRLRSETPASPAVIDVGDPHAPWPFREAAETGKSVEVNDLTSRFGPLPGGAWPEPPQRAVVLPLARSGQTLAGFVVAGVSPRLPFNDEYRGFTDLLAGHVAAVVAGARAYEEERRRAEALAELDRAKTAFFSNVSHEFRTPLTLMLGPVEDLLTGGVPDLPPAARDQLEVVNRNGLRLLRLVNSLLDFSRIEAGRVRASYQPTDLAALTADLASVFRAAVEKAGLRLAVECATLGEPVFVDPEMWEKVVLNLLSNAFKFTFEGEIGVSVRRAGDFAELRVRDTGTGVPAEELPRLFERFHRVENARGRTHEGSGIGLALVQELVKLHGGSVTAESEVGRGTTFTVAVPLGSAHLPTDRIDGVRTAAHVPTGAAPFVEEALRWLPGEDGVPGIPSELLSGGGDEPVTAHRPGTPPGGVDRPRVLVADDNADMRRYVVRLLADRYTVEAVPDGAAALAAARERTPDLILTDVMMPRLDGFGLLKALRADPRTDGLPVILLSARAGEDSRVEGMEAGADDYLVKPFGARELLARVGSLVQIARLRRESERAVRRSEERFRTLFETMSEGFAIDEILFDGSGRAFDLRYLDVNPAFERHTGLKRADILGRTTLELFPGAEPDWFERYGGVATTGVPAHFRAKFGPLDKWFEVSAYRTGPNQVAVVFFDITEQKRAEEQLRTSEAQFRTLVVNSPDVIARLDLDLRHTFISPVVEQYTGLRPDQFLGRSGREVGLPGDQCDGFEEKCRTAIRTRQPQAYEFSDDLNARPKFVVSKIVPEFGPDGDVASLLVITTDVTERKRAEDEARKVQDIFKLVHGIGRIGHWEWNSLTDENKWSPEIEALYGLPPGGFGGTYRAWADRLHPDDLPQAEADVRRAMETGQYFTEFRVIWPDGSVHWLEARAVVFKDGHDRPVRIVGVNMDVTERKRTEEALRDADRRKNEFLATLAHELRNPLAPIRNGLQLMRMAGVDAATVEKARRMMDRQLAQMVRLVDDLMDVSRISRGKLDLRLERVDLATVLTSAVETSRPLVEEMGHDLRVDLPGPPVVIDADPTRLAQVFLNLLNNAAKYSDRGGRIRLTAERRGGDVAVAVRDTGVGIAADQLPRLFEMFSQVDGSLERSQGGLGIGLSLVKRLVEMHGGTVEARSDGLGKGSEFVVRLPVVVEAAPPPPAPEVRADEPKSSLRILVVDDNRDGADSLADMLGIMGNDTRTAYDGEAAVAAAVEFRPDVILLDIGLPKLNGYEACRRIQAQANGRKVVVIAQTGWGQAEDRQRTQEAGFDHHLVKPVDPQTLMTLLAGLSEAAGR